MKLGTKDCIKMVNFGKLKFKKIKSMFFRWSVGLLFKSTALWNGTPQCVYQVWQGVGLNSSSLPSVGMDRRWRDAAPGLCNSLQLCSPWGAATFSSIKDFPCMDFDPQKLEVQQDQSSWRVFPVCTHRVMKSGYISILLRLQTSCVLIIWKRQTNLFTWHFSYVPATQEILFSDVWNILDLNFA